MPLLTAAGRVRPNRGKGRGSRDAEPPPPPIYSFLSTSVERAVGGAIAGAVAGLFVASIRAGCAWLGNCAAVAGPADFLPPLPAFVFRFLLPPALSGAVAGGLYAALLPRIYRIRGAIILTIGVLVGFVALMQLLPPGPHRLDEYFFTSLGIGAMAAVPLGAMAHEMALALAPDLEPLEKRTRSFGWTLVQLLQRLPGFGSPLRRRRRARLLQEPFPGEWLQILKQRVPVYRRLPEDYQLDLQRQVTLFLAEKKIEGCGLEVSDAVRVTIAAQACLLAMRLPGPAVDWYSRLRTVLVYPRTFVPRRSSLDTGSTEKLSARLGESWRAGVVVLSWKAVREGAADPDDGDNVTLHEFAHQLDQENGGADGQPTLAPPLSCAEWVRVLQESYDTLRADEAAGRETVLNYYGTTNLAELFAVATEAFFERPRDLRAEKPALYEQLRLFYRQDPAEYIRAGDGR